MIEAADTSDPIDNTEPSEIERLQQELEEAQKEIRLLVRQLRKEQARHQEAARAHDLTIANLSEISREQQELRRERDSLRSRAEGRTGSVRISDQLPTLSAEEALAIRRAMARLYAELGSSSERLKLWNALLDSAE